MCRLDGHPGLEIRDNRTVAEDKAQIFPNLWTLVLRSRYARKWGNGHLMIEIAKDRLLREQRLRSSMMTVSISGFNLRSSTVRRPSGR